MSFFYSVRNAGISDLEKIVETHHLSAFAAYPPTGLVSAAVMDETFGYDSLRKSWRSSLSDPKPRELSLIAGEGTDVVGVARCRIIVDESERAHLCGSRLIGKAEPLGDIQTLYVHPDHQDKGAGRVLMGAIGDWFLSQGAHRAVVITLDGYRDSPRFYRRVGEARRIHRFKDGASAAAGVPEAKAGEEKRFFITRLFPDVRLFASSGVLASPAGSRPDSSRAAAGRAAC